MGKRNIKSLLKSLRDGYLSKVDWDQFSHRKAGPANYQNYTYDNGNKLVRIIVNEDGDIIRRAYFDKGSNTAYVADRAPASKPTPNTYSYWSYKPKYSRDDKQVKDPDRFIENAGGIHNGYTLEGGENHASEFKDSRTFCRDFPAIVTGQDCYGGEADRSKWGFNKHFNNRFTDRKIKEWLSTHTPNEELVAPHSDRSPSKILMGRLKEKIEMDPLLYVDSNDELIRNYARKLVNGD